MNTQLSRGNIGTTMDSPGGRSMAHHRWCCGTAADSALSDKASASRPCNVHCTRSLAHRIRLRAHPTSPPTAPIEDAQSSRTHTKSKGSVSSTVAAKLLSPLHTSTRHCTSTTLPLQGWSTAAGKGGGRGTKERRRWVAHKMHTAGRSYNVAWSTLHAFERYATQHRPVLTHTPIHPYTPPRFTNQPRTVIRSSKHTNKPKFTRTPVHTPPPHTSHCKGVPVSPMCG